MYDSLVNFRNAKRLTQKQMADALGITLTYYSKIEIGQRVPSYNFLKKFKGTFPGVSVDKLFFNA